MGNKSITTNVFFAVSAKLFGMFVPLLTMPYIMRTLDVSSYGKVAYVQSLVAYFVLFATLGLNDFSLRECSPLRFDFYLLQRKVSQVFTISVITTSVSFFIFIAYALLIDEARTDFFLYFIFAFMILASGLQMDWLYWLNERFDLVSIRDVIGKVVYLILCFLLIKHNDDYLIYGFVLVASYNLIPFAINQINIWNGKCGVKPNILIDKELRPNLTSIAYLGLMTLGSKLFSSSDVILIKWLAPGNGDEAVGLYNSGIVLPLVVEQLIFVIVSVITPKLYKYLGHNDETQAQMLSNKISNVMYFVAVPAVLICVFFAHELLYLLGGSKYEGATSVLQIYSLILLCSVAITLAGTRTYVARKKEKKIFKILLTMAVFNILLDVFFIRQMGIKGVAIATVISNIALMIVELTLEHSWNLVFTKEKYKYILGAILLGTMFFLIRNVYPLYSFSILIPSIVIAGFIYVGFMYILKESTMLIVKEKFCIFVVNIARNN